MKTTFLILLLATSFTFPLASAAHWVAGYVENALDSTSPNDRTVRLWNPSNSQEIFGTIGPSGPSATSNVYMIDCETLTTPCQVGDKLNLTITNDASGYTPKNIVKMTVTGAGYDIAPNLTINTPPTFINLTIEDALSSPPNEIDLTPAITTPATCSGIIEDYEGATSILSIDARFFSSSSSFGSTDDNNNHYTNSSCEINTSYGTSIQAAISCTFEIEYYAEADTWQCQFNTTDNYSSSTMTSDMTSINTLLALGADSPIDFGTLYPKKVSPEITSQVTNYGNVKINLTLNGYGQTQNDDTSMSCGAKNISIDYMKYNLISSNSSNLTLTQFEAIYENLTSSPKTTIFNLNSRQSDISNDATNNTYWRVYVPQDISSACTGNIVFGATQS